MGSHFCENDKILKEKEAELDNFVHQPPRGGRSKSQFEPLTENEEIKVEKKMVDGKNKEMKVEDRRVCNRTNKTKEKQETEKRLSNHIEFIDYIPIHEVITYRHLFAYGFYVE